MALAGMLSGAPNPNNPDAIEDGYPQREAGPTGFAADGSDPAAADPENLLAIDPQKAAKKLVEAWVEQDQLHQRANAQARANARRREGKVNVQVVKSKDEDRWEEWSWGGETPNGNKAASLCRKASSVLHADPAEPQVLPASSEPEDVDAAEFAQDVLEKVCSDAELDDDNRRREAFDLASTYGSCFRYIRVDPRGRRQAVQIEAHPLAQSADAPFSIPVPATDQLGQPLPPDPMTGQAPMQLQPQPGPFPLRYVRQDRSLTDKKGEAMQEWVPKLVDELLPATHVRFLPATATYIDKAEAVLMGAFRSIAELKRAFPDEMEQQSEEQLAVMLKYRPERPDDFLPGRGRMERSQLDGLKGDNRLVFTISSYARSSTRYPDGLYICAAGETMLYRKPWSATMEDGTTESLEIPVTQHLQFREGKQTKDGVGLMEVLGAGNESRSAIAGSLYEYLDRFNSRKTFVPTSSIVRPGDLENPSKQYLPINPGGTPVTEEVPEFPRLAIEIYDRAGDDMDHASGLEEAAQGVEDPSVNSGKQAQIIVSQAHAGMSELRENAIRAATRGWRIMLQLFRAFYTKPQQLEIESADGRTRQRRWSRADLGSARDVRLKQASMSMMAPSAKIQYTSDLVAQGLLQPDEARELITSNLAATIGWRDEPYRLRIRRQIADWEEGPPEGWAPAEPQAVQDPTTGQMVLQPAPDPVLGPMWESVPADDLPPIAEIRLMEMAKAMSGVTYLRWPPEWRQAMVMEFQHMQNVVTMAQQAAAAAAAPQPGQKQPAPGAK